MESACYRREEEEYLVGGGGMQKKHGCWRGDGREKFLDVKRMAQIQSVHLSRITS
jgi:hypothetical protein